MDCGPREHPHPSRRRRAPYPFCPFGTFPPDRGDRPSPLGEGLRSGALAQHTQAQSENRTSSKFGPPRPQWGRKKTQASTPNFARRNHSGTSQESAPVKRGPGKGESKRRNGASPEPFPGAFCLLFRHGKRRSPPAGGEILCAESSPIQAIKPLPKEGNLHERPMAI